MGYGCYQDNTTEIRTWSEVFGNFPAGRINPGLATGGRTSRKPGWIRPRRFGRALSDGPDVGGGHSCDDGRGCQFTNTAVPRFDGTGCWQQHILIFQAIVRSNGWSLMTAALQLFAHLDGEALSVALLMPVKERERSKDLVDGFSEYYNSPGRLAVVRRRFESVSRRPGVDPATFATELGILAVHGFADMGERARDLMIRNKFIAAQQSCELRRHLDGAAADASIRDIVDSCRVCESHTEAGYDGRGGLNPKFLRTISQVEADAQPQLASEGSETLQENMRQLMPTFWVLSSAERELIIQRVLEAVRSRRPAIQKRSQEMEVEFMLRNMLPVGSVTEVDLSTPVLSLEGKVVPSSAVPLRRGSCFSCGQQGPWGDPIFADGRIFPFSVAGLVGGCAEWPIPGLTDTWGCHEIILREKWDGPGGRVSLPDHRRS